MDEIDRRVAQTALKDMFERSHFNICTIDKIIQMTGCIPDKQNYNRLSALHCIHWNTMEKDVRQWCFETTINLFDNTGFDLEMINGVLREKNLIEEAEASPGFFKKLGIG
ncbi:hypothetical protein LCGC14_2162200 [marine sediment metagenome]|uniref:Uncharacterized protein n=1 Tax=marine sediment metagenome TaxID=412755 RepID=A0A0F9EEP3_9ZZZZ